MGIAYLSGQRSKDPVTQVGACIVNDEMRIVGTGYNGLPNGCHDDDFPLKKTKLSIWMKESTNMCVMLK